MEDSENCTVLHYLANYACKSLEAVVDKVLSQSDEILSKVNKVNYTPLHVACQRGNQFMIYKLLQQKEGYKLLHQKDIHGKTPADLLSFSSPQREMDQCVIYLTAYGADIPPYRYSRILPQKPDNDVETTTPSISVVVTGNSSVGKTTLVRALENMLTGNYKNVLSKPQPTTGIVIKEVLAYNGHCYRFLDFAGQVEFETSHSQMLESELSIVDKATASSPYIFLLVTRSTDSWNDSRKQIEKWYRFLCNHLKGTNMRVKVALVCSHDDLLQDQDRKQERINNIEKYLHDLEKMLLDFKIDLHQKPFFLNCKETNTIPINALLRYFDDAIFSYKLVPPKFLCIELKKFLEKELKIPYQVRYLIQILKERRQFKFTDKIEVSGSSQLIVPHECSKLVQLLIDLSAQKDIILIKSTDDELSWWMISKCMQNVLFSKVSSIFSPSNFDNAPKLSSRYNTGVIPSNMLAEIFKDLCLSSDLIAEYLLYMDYCKVIEDKKVLNLIAGEVNVEESKHFFFPGLIRADKSTFPFPKPNADMYHCGWLVESEHELGLRFLHSLLLSLTFKFSRDEESSKYSERFFLWKCGLFWSTLDECNVLVEVQQDKKILALFRCPSDMTVLLAKLRSEVIHEIRDALHGSLVSDSYSEHFLLPPPQDFQNSEKLSQRDIRYPLVDMTRAFQQEYFRRSIDFSNSVKKISDILGFDPYVPLKNSTLRLLKSSDGDPDTLKQCFTALLKSKLSHDALEIILQCDSADNVHEEWMKKHETEPLQKLCSQLDKYSVFKLKELNIM